MCLVPLDKENATVIWMFKSQGQHPGGTLLQNPGKWLGRNLRKSHGLPQWKEEEEGKEEEGDLHKGKFTLKRLPWMSAQWNNSSKNAPEQKPNSGELSGPTACLPSFNPHSFLANHIIINFNTKQTIKQNQTTKQQTKQNTQKNQNQTPHQHSSLNTEMG